MGEVVVQLNKKLNDQRGSQGTTKTAGTGTIGGVVTTGAKSGVTSGTKTGVTGTTSGVKTGVTETTGGVTTGGTGMIGVVKSTRANEPPKSVVGGVGDGADIGGGGAGTKGEKEQKKGKDDRGSGGGDGGGSGGEKGGGDDADQEEDEIKVKLTAGTRIKLDGVNWKVIRMIGKGAYGVVYAISKGRRIAALKTGTGSDLRWEAKLMERSMTLPFVLKYISHGFGKHDEQGRKYDYLILEILHPMRGTLQDLVRKFAGKRLPVCWATRIAIMALRGLYELHLNGLLHRDIKPENVGILPEPNGHIAVLLDLGMGRFYTDKNGIPRPPRSHPGQKGTPSFMSQRVVGGREYGRVDDLWSWFYTYVELMKGECTMPWDEMGYAGDEAELEPDHIALKSPLITADVYLKNLPEEVYAIRIHLIALSYEDPPDYRALFTLLYRIIQKCSDQDPTGSFDPARYRQQDDQ